MALSGDDSSDWDVVEDPSDSSDSSPPETPPEEPLLPFYDASNAAHLELMGRVAVAIADMEARFDSWDEVAREAEASLRKEEAGLVLLRRDVNIAQTVGSATSSGVGVPLMVAGIIALPFTVGTSAVLTGLGTGISIVAGLTAGGASVAETVIRQKRLGRLKDLSAQLEALAPSLEVFGEEREEAVQEARSSLFVVLLETLREFAFLQPKKLEIAGGKTRLAALMGRSGSLVLKTGARALTFADDILAAAAKGGLIGARSGAVFSNATKMVIGSVTIALTAAVDAYTIVLSAKNMIAGNRDEAIDKLQEAADSIARVRGATQNLLAQAERVRRGDAAAVLDLMGEALACPLCLCLRQPHRCRECLNWVGCEECLVDWLLRSCTCPVCRHPWPLNEEGDPALEAVQGCEEILLLLQELDDPLS